MKYPWVFLTILGIWISTIALMIINRHLINPNFLFIFGSVCVLIVFLISFKKK